MHVTPELSISKTKNINSRCTRTGKPGAFMDRLYDFLLLSFTLGHLNALPLFRAHFKHKKLINTFILSLSGPLNSSTLHSIIPVITVLVSLDVTPFKYHAFGSHSLVHKLHYYRSCISVP